MSIDTISSSLSFGMYDRLLHEIECFAFFPEVEFKVAVDFHAVSHVMPSFTNCGISTSCGSTGNVNGILLT